MNQSRTCVKVIGNDACPFYSVGDEFTLCGKSLVSPYAKPTCLILVSDITAVVERYGEVSDDARYIFNCSGCSGLVRMEFQKVIRGEFPDADIGEQELVTITASMANSGFLQSLDDDHLQGLVSELKVGRYKPGDIVLQKGEPGRNLYIIAAGRVEVLTEDGLLIATLSKGDIFGEMSLISGEPVGASVQAVEPLTVLYLNGRYFRDLLSKTPAIQIFLTRLLARRIADANLIRSKEIADSLQGNVVDIPPCELLQTLHVNQKTGMLTYELPDEIAVLALRDGELVSAIFGGRQGVDAVHALLRIREGRFRFQPELSERLARKTPIGNMTRILIQGCRRDDPSAG